MDLLTLLALLISEGYFGRIMSNPLAQFGRPKKPYLGLQLMPERLVNENQFTEEKINYRTVIANDGTRYSPVQIKGSAKVGSFDVKLRSSDIGSEFKSSEYDALLKILKRYSANDVPRQAMISLLKWADVTLNMPLIVKNEKMIWEVIVNALVSRTGDNGYQEDVAISNPAGHRVAAVGNWSDDAYNPLDDIYAQAQMLANKGLIVNRQIAGTPVVAKLLKNAKVQAAVGGFINVSGGGALIGNSRRVTLDALNAYLAEDNIAPIIKYDNTYQDQAGSNFFLKRDVFVQIAETDQSETIDMGDAEPLTIESTLGYTGIGTTAGETNPGRQLVVEHFERKPPRYEGEAWQESFPVNQNPEAVSVIHSIE
jgi:Phage major capsid protein E